MRRAAAVLLLLIGPACGAGRPAAHAPTPGPVPTTHTATATRSTTPAVSPTGYEIRTVTAADLPSSWRSGCPVGPAQLRMLTVPFVGFDGVGHQGRLVVRDSVAGPLGRTFVRLYAQRFPIRSIRPVDDFHGDDDESMAADNTSAFNCRPAVGGNGSWSQHAYGLAVDLNTRENPYVYDGKVAPPDGKPFAQRSLTRTGMIATGGPVVTAFRAIGWSWGGYWDSSKDYQHFSANGR